MKFGTNVKDIKYTFVNYKNIRKKFNLIFRRGLHKSMQNEISSLEIGIEAQHSWN